MGIFVVAAALRLALAQTARFTGDEAHDYAVALELARGREAPALGPPLTDGRARLPGPLYYWMTALPLLFGRSPVGANVFYELLGAGTVVMFWLAVRKPFGEVAAAFAGLLMATSPWSALFGDRVWNPHAFLFVEAVAFLAAVRLRYDPDSRWAAFALPFSALALPQLHMSAPVVWLALLPLVTPVLRRANRRALAVGLVGGALLYVPYVIFEAHTGMTNTRLLIADVVTQKAKSGGAPVVSDWLWTPLYALRFLCLDTTYHELSGYWGGLDEAAAWRALWHGSPARPFHPLRLVALVASLALLAAGVLVVCRRLMRRRPAGAEPAADRRARVGPFGWSALIAVCADALLLAAAGRRVFAHYVIAVFPFVFVIYAALAQATLEASPAGRAYRAKLAALGALALVVAGGGVEATLSISRRIDARNGLGTVRAVSRRILADATMAGAVPTADLQFAFPATSYQYAVYSRYALDRPLDLRRGPNVPRYRLQRRDDPPPPNALLGSPEEQVGPVTLYRIR